MNYPCEHDPRLGVRTGSIVSGNDSDVCNSILTFWLLQRTPNALCVDIGVDKGWWSHFVLEHFPSTKIMAFEPNPTSFKQLQETFADKPNFVCHNIAISNTKGSLPFVCAQGDSHSRTKDMKPGQCIEVPCERIDPYLEGTEVTLMKIDTEGHELQVFDTLESHFERIQTIIFECSVYWYANTIEDAIQKTIERFLSFLSVYPHIYILNGRNLPPVMKLDSEEKVRKFVAFCAKYTLQKDVLLSKVQLPKEFEEPFELKNLFL